MKTGSDTPETPDSIAAAFWFTRYSKNLTECVYLRNEVKDLRNLLSTVLKFGLTDQVKTEAENFLREPR
jgi:hypothetical protein